MANVGEISATLTLNATQFNQAMQSAHQQMTNTSNSAKKVSKDFEKIQTAALAVGGAVAVGIGAAVTTAANFERKLSDIEAVSGATNAQMKQLAELAKEAGRSTAFSAIEAAAGIEELIKAGLTIEQIMGGGLKGALDLASAGNLKLADAAEVASTALNAFRDDQLSVSSAANILAGAANASATDVGELKFGLSAVSAVASSVGMTFQDTATALAVFAQNGLKGSDAGTSLKTMLSNLQPTTKGQIELFHKLGLLTKDGTNAFYTQEGQIKSLAEISGTLRQSMGHMTDQQRILAMETIFGSDAIRASNILYKESAVGINNMWSAMSKITAAETAATKLDNLYGSVEELKGSMETLGIEIGEDFLPLLTDFAKEATKVIRGIDDMDMANAKGAITFAGTAAAVALVVSGLGKLGIAARTLMTTMGPAGWLITGVSLLSGVIAGAAVKNRELDEVMLDHIQTQIKEQNALDTTIKQYDDLRLKSKLTTEEFARFVDINSELSKTANPDIIARLNAEQEKLSEKSGLSNEELNRMVGLNNDLITAVPEATKTITDQGNAILDNTSKLKQYSAAKLASLYQELDLERIKTETKYRDLLVEETDLIEDRNKQEEHMQELMNGRNDARVIANKEEAKLNEMLANSEEYSQAALDAQIQKNAAAQTALKQLQEQLEKEAQSIQNTDKDLENMREKLKKITEVHNQMKQIALQQVGLNSEVGKEVQTIDSAIASLKSQKAALEATTPVAQRNKGEYQEAVGAINQQISSLESARSKVVEITGAASRMNAELGKQIRKDVIIRQVEGQSLKRMPGLDNYHTGGITGRGQMPQLHTGGLASKFADLPSHNEIDVRLLRNEMVLTESQQANLMRMIDAGVTGKGSGTVVAETDPNLVKAITDLAKRPVSVEIDRREVARATYQDVNEMITLDSDRRKRF
ncbi:phage tail tape measure protein [Neobacillus drentensis]|uniref:phage tail tape measure protein n=1 Tax=Neobacillus drentensis TaxID=220684 RepID=UPI002FFD78C8